MKSVFQFSKKIFCRFYSAILHKALCVFFVFQVTSLTCRVAELQGLLDRGDRERNSLNTQLEEAFKKLTTQETDNSRVQKSHTGNSIMLRGFFNHFHHRCSGLSTMLYFSYESKLNTGTVLNKRLYYVFFFKFSVIWIAVGNEL